MIGTITYPDTTTNHDVCPAEQRYWEAVIGASIRLPPVQIEQLDVDREADKL